MNIVITGASEGIGRAIAFEFAAQGFNLAVCARREHGLEHLKQELAQLHPKIQCLTLPCDVSDKSQVRSFAAEVKMHFRNVDVLVNNAGTYLPGLAHQETDGTLEKLMQVNLYGAYYLTQALIPAMMEVRDGHIFNISSIAGIQPYENGGSYSISKFAVTGFSRNLREEMKPYGVRVTNVCPGAVHTGTWSGSNLPRSRFIAPEDIARMIYQCWEISKSSCVEELVIRPQQGDI